MPGPTSTLEYPATSSSARLHSDQLAPRLVAGVPPRAAGGHQSVCGRRSDLSAATATPSSGSSTRTTAATCSTTTPTISPLTPGARKEILSQRRGRMEARPPGLNLPLTTGKSPGNRRCGLRKPAHRYSHQRRASRSPAAAVRCLCGIQSQAASGFSNRATKRNSRAYAKRSSMPMVGVPPPDSRRETSG